MHAVSLFSGAITARTVRLGSGEGRIVGLTIEGRAQAVRPNERFQLQRWGYATTLPSQDDTKEDASTPLVAALVIHLVATHSELPAGTVVLVSLASGPRAKARATAAGRSAKGGRRRGHKQGRPLTVTPPLGEAGYVFPVVGASAYVDTYGAFRSDVAGHWHHGDDIFAPLGTPVVAVATGTLNRAGWEVAGGWRLWVRDELGNEFYYAHLSGYSAQALHSTRVQAGEVIGFIGNTGDAYTTAPHLHFEIHPRPLLHLHYNGAVDPTGYLDHWHHLERAHAPRPVHPPYPPGAARQEARTVWRELLVARHLVARVAHPHLVEPRRAAAAPEAKSIPRAVADSPTVSRSSDSSSVAALLAALIMASIIAVGGAHHWRSALHRRGALMLRRLRRDVNARL